MPCQALDFFPADAYNIRKPPSGYGRKKHRYQKYIRGQNPMNKNGAVGKGGINLPNKLTILRIILVPVFMVFILVPAIPELPAKIFAAIFFLAANITDFLDGVIARRRGLVTDFGKLMDPLADKFMVVGALLAITASDMFSGLRYITVIVTSVVFFRELAVTSLRLVANTADGNVIAANTIAKLKTFSQCVCIMTVLLEEILLTNTLGTPANLFSIITMVAMCALTIISGYIYFKSYWGYIDPTK